MIGYGLSEIIFRQNVKQRDSRLSSFHTIYTKVDNYDPTINIYGDTSLLTIEEALFTRL